jgi:hypothetical protein
MSPNVKASMGEWDLGVLGTLPRWALEAAAEITEATVPQIPGNAPANMLYALPAGLKCRLTAEIAQALVDERAATEAAVGAL